MSVNIDGHEVLIPTVVGDRVVSDAEAIKHFKKTGAHLGVFDTPKNATAYAQKLHENQAQTLTEPEHQGVPDGWTVVAKPSKPEPSKGHDFKVLGVNIHVPGEAKPRADSNMIGWGENGAGVAPEDALMVGQAARGVAKAAAGGVVSGAKQMLAEASPVIKYEATRTVLEKMGVPSHMAAVAAMAVSGYNRKSPKVAAEPVASNPTAPHLDLSVPVRPSQLTPQQLSERMQAIDAAGGVPEATKVAARQMGQPYAGRRIISPVETVGGGAAPPSGPLPSPAPASATPTSRPSSGKSPQQILNEEALAARRAAAQVQPSEPAAAPKPKLTAPEFQAATEQYTMLRNKGLTDAQARKAIETMRSVNQQFGLSTPTKAETRFPKGMRGKVPPKP